MTTTFEQQNTIQTDSSDNQRNLDALCDLIELAQGRFALALVDIDLPSKLAEIIGKVRESLPQLNIVEANITPAPGDAPRAFNVLDQLDKIVKNASPDQTPDALIITGLESLFAEDLKKEFAPPSEDLIRAVQPLNLGRNLLAKMFPCPVVLCLPNKAMGLLVRSAPDFVSWQSGSFNFVSDLNQVQSDLQAETPKSTSLLARWSLRRLDVEALEKIIKQLEAFIKDAQTLPADKETLARLYWKLGWACVYFGDATQARKAFVEMLSVASELNHRRLMYDAEYGQEIASRTKSRKRELVVQAVSTGSPFYGAAALTQHDKLYGRDDETAALVRRVDSVKHRIVTVWGGTGCGKSSLVEAGLIPELERLGRYLPVIVRQWNEPIEAIKHALEIEANIVLESSLSLHDSVQLITEQTQKIVVIVCDQFEQLFQLTTKRSQRKPILKAIGECLDDLKLPCKFVFVMREDELGKLAEFDDYVYEPLAQSNRFYLPLFNSTDAVNVLRQQSTEGKLGWTESFIRAVVEDLSEDEQVRPVQLQLVGEALRLSDIDTVSAYVRAGRAKGLLTDYLEIALKNLYTRNFGETVVAMQALLSIGRRILGRRIIDLAIKAAPFADHQTGPLLAVLLDSYLPSNDLNLPSNYFKKTTSHFIKKTWLRETKSILLHLVAEPTGRLALSVEALADRAGNDIKFTQSVLNRLCEANIVRRVKDSSADEDAPLYELTHDILAELTLQITRDLRDKRRQASRVLNRALEDNLLRPRNTIGLHDWWLARNNAPKVELDNPKVRFLLARSLIWGILKYLVTPTAVVLLLLIFIQETFCYVTLERDFNNRAVIRRGIPYLSFLPFIGGDGSGGIILDTGLSADDLNREKIAGGFRPIHWQWGNLRSGILGKPEIVDTLSSPELRIMHLLSIADSEKGFEDLIQSLRNPRGYRGREAAMALKPATKATPELVLATLLPFLQDKQDGSVRNAAVTAIGQVAQARPELVQQDLFNTLLEMLKDKQETPYGYGRGAAATAIGRIAQAKPELVQQDLLDTLLEMLKDKQDDPYGSVRSIAVTAIGQVAQARPELVQQDLFNTLLQILEGTQNNPDGSVRGAAVTAIGQVAQARPELVQQDLLDTLLEMLKDKQDDPYGYVRRIYAATAIGQVAQARPELVQQDLFNTLLQVLKGTQNDPEDTVQKVFADALGQVAQAKPELALATLLPLLQDKQNVPDGSRQKAFAATAIGQVVQVRPELVQQDLLDTLLEMLKDKQETPYVSGRSAAATAIGRIAQAKPELALATLLPLLQDKQNVPDGSVRRIAVTAIGQVAQARPELVQQDLFNTLLEMLKDKQDDSYDYVLNAAATAIGQVAQARPELVQQDLFNTLLEIFKDIQNTPYTGAGSEVAAALGQVAGTIKGTEKQVCLLLKESYDEHTRNSLIHSLATTLAKQAKDKNEPAQFLLQHLKGQQSFMPDGDANTYAVYRDVVVEALAQWLVSKDEKAIVEREALTKELEIMRDNDSWLHLRMAAWNVFIKEAELRENQDNDKGLRIERYFIQ
jgi:HEAT repeat protein